MAPETRLRDPVPSEWHRRTLALSGGVLAASAMFYGIAAVQTPGLDPPPESTALFLGATVAGVVSTVLLQQESTAGYPAAILTAVIVVAVVAVIVVGTYGPPGPRTNPIGPVSYVGLAVAVGVSAGVAWRRSAATESRSRPERPS